FEEECATAGGTVSARDVLSRIGTGAGGPREEMLTAIRRIKEEGLKTAAITNNFVREGGGRPGFRENLFDLVVESSVLGVRKPNPKIYLHTCEQLAIEPKEAVFLDDLGVNLKPARELGMTTIKVVDPDVALKELEEALQFSLR
ncbi:MAG: HAD family hydrolase, partial [Acidimicrobiia bacterium]